MKIICKNFKNRLRKLKLKKTPKIGSRFNPVDRWFIGQLVRNKPLESSV